MAALPPHHVGVPTFSASVVVGGDGDVVLLAGIQTGEGKRGLVPDVNGSVALVESGACVRGNGTVGVVVNLIAPAVTRAGKRVPGKDGAAALKTGD